MDSASLPFYHLTILTPQPKKPGFPKALLTIGDHIRKRRLDLGLFQRQVALQIGVAEASVWNWEKGGMKPKIRHLPAIISFLGTTLCQSLTTCKPDASGRVPSGV